MVCQRKNYFFLKKNVKKKENDGAHKIYDVFYTSLVLVFWYAQNVRKFSFYYYIFFHNFNQNSKNHKFFLKNMDVKHETTKK